MKKIRSVIFDMDGVLIDSEKQWNQTERELFSSLGVPVTDHYSHITEVMTITETVRFWHEKYPWEGSSIDEVAQMAVTIMKNLIEKEVKPIEGVYEFIEKLREKNFLIGLASNSPDPLIHAALQKTGMSGLFDVTVSAESTGKGKPDPAVYILAAQTLGVDPAECVAIEDSGSGLMAAKNAGMAAIAFTHGGRYTPHELADGSFSEFKNAAPDMIYRLQEDINSGFKQ